MTNPLLNFDQLPYFDRIRAEHAIPALQQVLDENRQSVEQLAGLASPDWQNFALQMENLDERVSRVWSPVSHLNAVQDSSELREAYQAGIAMLTDYHTELGQHSGLYQQYKTLQQSNQFNQLTAAQRKVIDNALLDFRLSGAELCNDAKAEFSELNQQLSELANQFERNLLDATQAWSLHIEDRDTLSGLPDSAMQMAAQLAQQAGHSGWLLNLQIPSYLAVMQHADDGALREKMYRAYATRASEVSDHPEYDNSRLINKILQLRTRKSSLLGLSSYAEYSLVKKMAESSESVLQFLADLTRYAKPVAQQELQELRDFASDHYGVSDLSPWDISYYSEKLREHQYAFNDEQVKPYLPVERVLHGLFEIVGRLFNIDIVASSEMDTWHPDVECFDVVDRTAKQKLGSFYTDLYVRRNKRGGAWMDSCIHRRRLSQTIQQPVAFLTCNFSPPLGDQPALLTHGEVETLFHEFGHTLHHLLTQVDEMSVAGINGVAWDAVELPSQFLENWCREEQGLALISGHYQTGQALPTEMLQKLLAAKNFQSGLQTLRQVEFAVFDMRLHDGSATDVSVQQLLDQVRAEVAVLPTPEYHRFQNSFAHIFAGGYAAGYYSYKWSEVLSADAFARFEEEGLFDAETGKQFRQKILARGGVDDANQLFVEFRGKPPSIKPLLRHSGILR